MDPIAAVPASATPGAVARLLRAIIAREHAGRVVASTTRAGLAAAAALLVLGSAGRLTGYQPHLLGWIDLLIPPAAGLAWALLTQRRIGLAAAAHRADQHLHADDLLLSAIAPDLAQGALAGVVRSQAEQRARIASAPAIVPLSVRAPALRWLAVLAAVAVAVAVVPVLDPFAHQKRLLADAAQRAEIAKARDAVARRAADVAATHPDEQASAAVAQDMARLQAELAAMKPAAIASNKQQLSSEQATLRGRLDQVRAERFDRSVAPTGEQELGGEADRAVAKQLSDALEHGKAAETQAAIDQASAIARQLQAATDPQERARLADQLAHQLATLQQAAQSHPSGFSAAVQNALDQLARSSSPELHDQALQGLRDALELAKLEAASDAQGARDLQDLQQSLQAMQLAQQLNDQGDLQGQAGSMEEYAAMYARMLANRALGPGQGQGQGQGSGEGDGYRTDSAKDDGKVDAGFSPAQLHAPLKPGQTIAEWTVHGATDPGAVLKAYQDSLPEVRQEVPAALEREQVPPAYHDGVKKYFDGLAADH
jgi:hypothetical protein